jgi:tungstate transport system ATP-binding protein
MKSAAILEARGLRVARGGVQVLDIPSFRLEGGEFVSLIGPNGCGKSSLLLSLMCLLPRTSGQVLFRGTPIEAGFDAVASRRKMAMVLQDPLLFHASVYDNVATGLRIRGLTRSEERRRVMAHLERFGLDGMAQRSARALSGGEARRVSIARALAVEPEVVFLDEPFANLDPPTRQGITDDLEEAIREKGAATILVTHDQSEALRLSDRIVVMQEGSVIQSDVPSVVMNSPVNAYVAACMGMETVVSGVVVRCTQGGGVLVSVAGAEIFAIGEAAAGDRVYCGIRPEQVTIETNSTLGTSSARNVLQARIEGVSSVGPYLKVKLDCGFPLVATVTGESLTTLGLARDKIVFASFKATAVHLIRRSDTEARPRGAGPGAREPA